MNLPLLEIQRLAAPLRQQVLERLREAIIGGQLAPGQRLVERALTDKLGVSRTVVREVVRQLESEGLVAIIPNRGPVVRELSTTEARDLYTIRAALEGLAARLCVERAAAGQITKLGATLDGVAAAYKSGDADAVLATKNRFYALLFESAGSEALSSMLTTLHARIWRWRALGLTHPKRSARRSEESVKGLKAILAAIKRRDADAAERLTREEAQHAAAEVLRLIEIEPAPVAGRKRAAR
jgi:DNA-binding GntR family transcriptional regulator